MLFFYLSVFIAFSCVRCSLKVFTLFQICAPIVYGIVFCEAPCNSGFERRYSNKVYHSYSYYYYYCLMFGSQDFSMY